MIHIVKLLGTFIFLIFCLINMSQADAEIADNIEIPLQEHLPIITIPAKSNSGKSMVVMISGDGGFTAFDQGLVKSFSDNGIPVVVLNSLKYFWSKKSPEQTTADLSRIMTTYQKLWKKEEIFFIGYSFGADVVPFVYNRLSGEIKNNISRVAILSPSKTTDLEIHLSDMIHLSETHAYSVVEEVNKMNSLKPICFFGENEKDVSPLLFKANSRLVELQGDHRYNDNYKEIIKTIVD